MKQIYTVRKYIVATSAKAAIRLEKNYPVDDVFVDDDVRKQTLNEDLVKNNKRNLGFNYGRRK
jgi:hypothetical protein